MSEDYLPPTPTLMGSQTVHLSLKPAQPDWEFALQAATRLSGVVDMAGVGAVAIALARCLPGAAAAVWYEAPGTGVFMLAEKYHRLVKNQITLPSKFIYDPLDLTSVLSEDQPVLVESRSLPAELARYAPEFGLVSHVMLLPLAQKAFLGIGGFDFPEPSDASWDLLRLLQPALTEAIQRILSQKQFGIISPASTVAASSPWQEFAQHTTDGLVFLDRRGVVMDWNHGMQAIVNLPREDVIGKPFWDIVTTVYNTSPDIAVKIAQLKESYDQLAYLPMSEWPSGWNEELIVCGSGRPVWLQWLIFSVKGRKDRWVGIIIRNITRRVEIERELHQIAVTQEQRVEERTRYLQEEMLYRAKVEKDLHVSQELWATLVMNAADAIALTSLQGYFQFVNASGVALMGAESEDQIIGTRSQSWIAPEYWGEVTERLRDIVRDRVTRWEIVLITKKGKRIPVEQTVSMLYDAQGNPQQLMTISRDISSRRELQQLQEDYSRHLEVIHQFDQEILRAQNVNELLSVAFGFFEQIIAFDAGGFVLLDTEKKVGQILFWTSFDPSSIKSGDTYPYHYFRTDGQFLNGGMIYLPDLNDPFVNCSPLEEVLQRDGFRSFLKAPIWLYGSVRGSISLVSRQPEFFTKERMNKFNELVELLSIGLEKVLLLQEAQERAGELGAIAALSEKLRVAEKIPEMQEVIVDYLRQLLRGDGAVLCIQQDEQFTLEVLRGSPAGLPWIETMSGQVMQTGQVTYYHESNSADLSSMVMLPIKTSRSIFGALGLWFSNYHSFTESENRLLVAVSEIAGNALHRARVMETMEQRVLDRTRELSALYDITVLGNDTSDSSRLLAEIVERALQAVRADYGMVLLIDAAGNEKKMKVASLYGVPAKVSKRIIQIVNEKPFSYWNDELNSPMILDDLGHHPVLGSYPRNRQSISSVSPYLSTPLRTPGNVVGIFSILRSDGPQFTFEDVALLSAISDQLGSILENARLRKRAEEAVIMEERSRLARELHDSVTQSLYSLMLFSESALKSINVNRTEKLPIILQDIRDGSHQALKEMRLLVYELRPSVLETMRLPRALAHRLDSVEKRAGVQVELQVEGAQYIPRELESDIYRVAIEGLNNSLKHASASSVLVKLKGDPGSVMLEVIDNGVGFELEAGQTSGGLGLAGIAERAGHLGGKFTIQTEPGQGVRLNFYVPMREGVDE